MTLNILFITTETNNCDPIVQSFESVYGPVERLRWWHERLRVDPDLVLAAERGPPAAPAGAKWDAIFYIGACGSVATPSAETLRMIGRAAPTVHICFDGGDAPWWPYVQQYRDMGCFKLQVNIDGAHCPGADMIVTCPVVSDPYDTEPAPERDINFGFAGGVGTYLRSWLTDGLIQNAGLQVRVRTGYETRDYADYARFMRRCRMMLNVPLTGTGQYMHVKSRIIEAGLAGCAVLEHKQSPAFRWFGPEAMFAYETIEDIIALVGSVSPEEVARKAAFLSARVRSAHMPVHIWGAVMQAAGVTCPAG